MSATAKKKATKKKATKKKKGEEEQQEIIIPKLTVKKIQIPLESDSGLISHRWSKKAKEEMLRKQMKLPALAKEAKNPALDYAESLYLFDVRKENEDKVYQQIANGNFKGTKFCFPAVAFKSAAVSACRFADGVTMVAARGAFHVVGEFVEIESDDPPEMREDMVRIGQGTADLRYRGEFKRWRAMITVRYNTNALSPDQIVNLFNLAGFGVGVGEWRPEKDGSNGMFHVATG